MRYPRLVEILGGIIRSQADLPLFACNAVENETHRRRAQVRRDDIRAIS